MPHPFLDIFTEPNQVILGSLDFHGHLTEQELLVKSHEGRLVTFNILCPANKLPTQR